MDVSFPPTPQTRSLVTCNPLSSSSSSLSLLSSCRVRSSLRRDFLGCGRNLSPPGLRSHKRCKKLGFYVHSPRLIVKASLDPQSMILVVSVVTVSALTVLYLNSTRRRQVAKEMSGLALSQEVGGFMNGAIVDQIMGPVDIQEETSADDYKALVKDIRQTSHDYDDIVAELQFKETSLVHAEAPITYTLVSPGSISISDAIPTREPQLKGLSSLPSLVHKSDAVPFTLTTEMCNVLVEECEKQSERCSEFEPAMPNTESIAASVPAKNTRTRVDEFESEIDSDNGISEEFVRKELYTFYEANQSAIGFMKNSNSMKSLTSHASLKKHNPFSSLPRSSTVEGAIYPTVDFLYSAGYTIEMLIYCIEMLEDMEKKGLLDMDKIYHAGYLRVCKDQKAVKEAFRFVKLIPDPTLSTFNMLMSVCACSQDSEGAFQVLKHVQEAGLRADCKLYTTLISTCAKCGKVDLMFKVFHEMVNAAVEPNVHTYGALIDGCAKAGQVAKAFGAYGIMRSKNVKPDRVVFNALITACGQSGAVDRAFDVLAEMRAETQPIDPDHVTVGALIKACANSGQVERAQEVYNMIHEYKIKGTPEVYTIAVNSCSQTGDWDFASSVYNDMKRTGVCPDEMFISALIDVAGHAGKLDAAFEILQEARAGRMHVGIISYSSLMGACSNAKNWQKALELYEDIKTVNMKLTVSTMNALITALCVGDQLSKALEVFLEMKRAGLCANTITYSVLFVASEKKDDLEVGLMLYSQATKDGLPPNLVMCRSLIAMCFRRFEKACTRGEPVLSSKSGRLQIDNKWTALVLRVYRETIIAGVLPTTEELSLVLGCLRLPHDESLRNTLIENLGVSTDTSKGSNLCSLIDGFGEYDPRALSVLEEASSLGIVPSVSLKESPIVIDLRTLPVFTAEVYLLTVLKGLKHRLAAGARLSNIIILLPMEQTQIQSSKGVKKINLSGRISQAVAALLRRLGISYLGNESYGKIRINGVVVKRWFLPKLASRFSGKPSYLSSNQSRLGRGITHQQRNIRSGNL
ncbi:hypothetical protein RJ639_037816 [Escallonia herrerae]|uniref:Pentatricopeptide repeat-containing protein-mitochondrial domain-containing protein n=1 Tax=Escallonia herrerae TaxID=1293975 RepID=A0AA89BDI0_9ASTE|nr:hypothetical protein RJ639_037816 [Escallonia herrerae]